VSVAYNIYSVLNQFEVASQFTILSGGQAQLAGGTISLSGVMDIAGSFIWKSGTLSGSGIKL
jgi:hypothetical protein